MISLKLTKHWTVKDKMEDTMTTPTQQPTSHEDEAPTGGIKIVETQTKGKSITRTYK